MTMFCVQDGWYPKQATSTFISSRTTKQNSAGRDTNPIINVRVPVDAEDNPRINFKIRPGDADHGLQTVPPSEIRSVFEPEKDPADPSGRKYMPFIRSGDAIITVSTVTSLASSGKTKINVDLTTFVMDEPEAASGLGADIDYPTPAVKPENPHHTKVESDNEEDDPLTGEANDTDDDFPDIKNITTTKRVSETPKKEKGKKKRRTIEKDII